MNKLSNVLEELENKFDRLRQKVKQSKVICKNNTESSPQIVFAHNVYGANKILTYDITVSALKPVNIVIKLDDVIISTVQGLMSYGEILLKSNKLYSLVVECTGESILAGKLKLESADLRVI